MAGTLLLKLEVVRQLVGHLDNERDVKDSANGAYTVSLAACAPAASTPQLGQHALPLPTCSVTMSTKFDHLLFCAGFKLNLDRTFSQQFNCAKQLPFTSTVQVRTSHVSVSRLVCNGPAPFDASVKLTHLGMYACPAACTLQVVAIDMITTITETPEGARSMLKDKGMLTVLLLLLRTAKDERFIMSSLQVSERICGRRCCGVHAS